MAFFGITNLGYQNPIRDKMLVNPRTTASHDDEVDSRGWAKQVGLPPTQIRGESYKCTDVCTIYNQPSPYSQDIHRGSQERYREMLRRIQTPRSPNQLYSVPVTDNQQYGWWNSNHGQGRMQESWAHVKRFPRKNSEMTKFVKEMSMTDREFSLY
ncbi:sperm microtubule inner protein 11-like [Osmerus mordax]|uniref:sperm microtubule inner protein 11-like n=1 Tax=Osmerus mordax TaxID=8014 RepID=UPI00351049C1